MKITWVLVATVLAAVAGCDDEQGDSDRAAQLLSRLAVVTYTEPQRVDAEIRSNPGYRSEAVSRCLQAIAQGAVGPATEMSAINREVNLRMQTVGGSYEPASNPAGDALLWATSVQQAIAGTPWNQTDLGSLHQMAFTALQVLMHPAEYRQLRDQIDAAIVEHARVNGPLVRCP